MPYAIEVYPLDGLTRHWPSRLAAENARDQIAANWGISRHAFRVVAVRGDARAVRDSLTAEAPPDGHFRDAAKMAPPPAAELDRQGASEAGK